MTSIRQRHADNLETLGWTRDYNARTGKYWVYTKPDTPVKIYLGRAGAFRGGKSATMSRPVPTRYLNHIAESAQKIRDERASEALNEF